MITQQCYQFKGNPDIDNFQLIRQTFRFHKIQVIRITEAKELKEVEIRRLDCRWTKTDSKSHRNLSA